MHNFVITHKPMEWETPVEHQLVTVNGYKQEGAIDASDTIGELNLNRTFAFYGGTTAILENIKDLPDDDHIFVTGYRNWLSNEFNPRIDFAVPENATNSDNPENDFRKMVTPEQLYTTFKDKVMTEFPKEYELVIAKPILLPCPILEQYARYHHLDDFLAGLSVAVRSGLLNQSLVAQFLTMPIHMTAFACKISLFRDLYEKIWWIAKELYSKHYVQRSGYQERSINFTLERICSLYLMQKVYAEKIPTICTGFFQIDRNLIYKSGA
jgi:hypothetical protein